MQKMSMNKFCMILTVCTLLLVKNEAHSQEVISDASLDFPVNSAQINPDYADNTCKLHKIGPVTHYIATGPAQSPQPSVNTTNDAWTRRILVKSNAIGWALLVSNAAIEIDLTRHWSFTLPIYYSACNYFTSKLKFRTFTIQPEARYWLTPDNEGWFGGVHFGMGYYNIALGGDYRTQDHDRNSPAVGGGVAVGYRMPLGKSRHWKLEFSLGGGVYATHYDKFRNEPNGKLVKTDRKAWVGIDQAAVSFAYTFDLKKKKGGNR